MKAEKELRRLPRCTRESFGVRHERFPAGSQLAGYIRNKKSMFTLSVPACPDGSND
jgi:hypothetical protein